MDTGVIMKKYRILIVPLFTAVFVIAAVAYLMTGIVGNEQIQDSHSDQWLVKKEETLSRLLKVPIILYHDIDGKGIYSVSIGPGITSQDGTRMTGGAFEDFYTYRRVWPRVREQAGFQCRQLAIAVAPGPVLDTERVTLWVQQQRLLA